MTPTKIRERLEEGGVDRETYFDALAYVHDDGRRHSEPRR
jgi:hypothetical protein